MFSKARYIIVHTLGKKKPTLEERGLTEIATRQWKNEGSIMCFWFYNETFLFKREDGGTLRSWSKLPSPVLGLRHFVSFSTGSCWAGVGCNWRLQVPPETAATPPTHLACFCLLVQLQSCFCKLVLSTWALSGFSVLVLTLPPSCRESQWPCKEERNVNLCFAFQLHVKPTPWRAFFTGQEPRSRAAVTGPGQSVGH